jgi:DNA-binding response OmpR family regulator
LRILIVDDDPRFRDFVSRGLAHHGYLTDTVDSAAGARQAVQGHPNGHYDLILLDVLMPGQSGWQLLEHLREGGTLTPVIFVTARGATEDRINGLRLGADDYIVKPFDFAELLARIESVIRRHRTLPTLHLGPLSLDLQRRILTIAGKETELPPKEHDLLCALIEARGQTLSRKVLLQKVWNIEFDPRTNTVDVCVGRLRRKLKAQNGVNIDTVIGEGYRLVLVADDSSQQEPSE